MRLRTHPQYPIVEFGDFIMPFQKGFALALLLALSGAALGDEYNPNADFVRYLIETAQVGDHVESTLWGRTSRYKIVEKKWEGDKLVIIFDGRDAGSIYWEQWKDDPVQCEKDEKTTFCWSARRVE